LKGPRCSPSKAPVEGSSITAVVQGQWPAAAGLVGLSQRGRQHPAGGSVHDHLRPGPATVGPGGGKDRGLESRWAACKVTQPLGRHTQLPARSTGQRVQIGGAFDVFVACDAAPAEGQVPARLACSFKVGRHEPKCPDIPAGPFRRRTRRGSSLRLQGGTGVYPGEAGRDGLQAGPAAGRKSGGSRGAPGTKSCCKAVELSPSPPHEYTDHRFVHIFLGLLALTSPPRPPTTPAKAAQKEWLRRLTGRCDSPRRRIPGHGRNATARGAQPERDKRHEHHGRDARFHRAFQPALRPSPARCLIDVGTDTQEAKEGT